MFDHLAIVATGVRKSYGAVRVLAGVDLAVPRGSVFALLGPNGAGKTTLVRILSTLVTPDAGRVFVAGFDVIRKRHEVRRTISLTGQYAAVDDLQTGGENLVMMARLTGLGRIAAHRRAAELLDRFGLGEAAGRRVGTYSGGMRRRLDLAASLVTTPSVIFLDEPTTGLDLPSRLTLWQVISELAGSGVTVFLTTQYLEEADQVADRIGVVDHGRMVAEGSPAELKHRFGDQRLDLTLADAEFFDAVLAGLGPTVLAHDETRLVISVATDGSAAHVRSVLDEVDPHRSTIARFSVHAATIDDVFLALTGHAAGETPNEKETAGV